MAIEEVKKKKNSLFKKLSKIIIDLKLSGTNIYSAGESGLTLVNTDGKITAPKASKTVFMRKRAERRENTTAAACNAPGTVMLPPMTICKGDRTNEDFMNEIFATFSKSYKRF
jgi:hypothetical protein